MTHDEWVIGMAALYFDEMSEQKHSASLLEKKAKALLDAITPRIVAAEREACAVLCDEAAAAYTGLLADAAKVVGDDLASMGSASAGACRSRAAAIRARKP